MVKNCAARQYIQEVKEMLPGAGKQKKAILNRIRTTVEEYFLENPGASYEEIVLRLGEPNQIAASCLEEMDTAVVMKQLRIKKTVVCIVTATTLAIVMLWAGVVLASYKEHYTYINGQFDTYIVDGTDIPTINGDG